MHTHTKKVPVSFPPALMSHSFPRPLIKRLATISSYYEKASDRGLSLPRVLFFIHGHELLVAERAASGEAAGPGRRVRLRHWHCRAEGGGTRTRIKGERVRGLTLDLDDYAVCVAYTPFTLACC